MTDFSVILQSPEVRSIVQENFLERQFNDALFPRQLFRMDVQPVAWPSGVGDTQIFSAPGLIPVDARPARPGVDPTPTTYAIEQWEATLQQYHGTTDTHMPTNMLAIANLLMRNAHQLGAQAAQTLNRVVRNRLYAAALAGHTVADGVATSTTSLRVKRLNGFTRARSANGSTVRFQPVSATNPLGIKVYDNGAEVSRNVVGFTPDTAGDEYGPGVLTLSASVTSVADRAYVLADDRTFLQRVGGGEKVDAVGSGDIPTFADVRTTIAQFWQNNVPEHSDGRFHCHLGPMSQAKLFNSDELQRMLTALPDYYMYKQFALGEFLNTVFFRNSECPVAETVVGGLTATYSAQDPFVGELTHNGAVGGTPIHRMLFTGGGAVNEYYAELGQLISEAGIVGAVGGAHVINNGIEVFAERIQMIIRAPMNRMQDQIATSWKFIGDWPTRTDAATGGVARYKRVAVIEHGA